MEIASQAFCIIPISQTVLKITTINNCGEGTKIIRNKKKNKRENKSCERKEEEEEGINKNQHSCLALNVYYEVTKNCEC